METWYGGNKLRYFIVGVSFVVPLLVAILILMPQKASLGSWVKVLPHFHAALNSLTTFVLIGALVAIKNKHVELHRNLMLSGVVMGALFLFSYVLYHSSVQSVVYGDLNGDGALSEMESTMASDRLLYLGLLVSHVLLSIFTLPLVLMALYRALNKQFDRHKKIVRWAYPLWLYVSVTGVMVYFMIRPFYL